MREIKPEGLGQVSRESRRRKLHIICFGPQPKALSFPCSGSFPPEPLRWVPAGALILSIQDLPDLPLGEPELGCQRPVVAAVEQGADLAIPALPL